MRICVRCIVRICDRLIVRICVRWVGRTRVRSIGRMFVRFGEANVCSAEPRTVARCAGQGGSRRPFVRRNGLVRRPDSSGRRTCPRRLRTGVVANPPSEAALDRGLYWCRVDDSTRRESWFLCSARFLGWVGRTSCLSSSRDQSSS